MNQPKIQTYRRGIALVRNFTTGSMLRWLGAYNRSEQMIEFVSGERLEGESFREAVMREVAWTLDVDRQTDFLTSKMAQLNLEFVDVLGNDRQTRHYHVAFYNVEVYRERVLEKINGRDDLIWLTSKEICQGRTRLGIAIDPVLTELVRRSDVIQHWESDSSQQEI